MSKSDFSVEDAEKAGKNNRSALEDMANRIQGDYSINPVHLDRLRDEQDLIGEERRVGRYENEGVDEDGDIRPVHIEYTLEAQDLEVDDVEDDRLNDIGNENDEENSDSGLADVLGSSAATTSALKATNSSLIDVFTLAAYGELESLKSTIFDRITPTLPLLHIVNESDSYGLTLSHESARSGHVHVLKWLAEVGAFLHNVDSSGQTPLHLASGAGEIECVRFILANNGSSVVNVKDNKGRTALHWASLHDHNGIVNLLILAGANPALTDNMGKPSMGWTSQFKSKQSIAESKSLRTSLPSPPVDFNQEADLTLLGQVINGDIQVINDDNSDESDSNDDDEIEREVRRDMEKKKPRDIFDLIK